MGWKDLIEEVKEKSIISPWCGGRFLQTKNRGWKIIGRLPREYGWYKFNVKTREATLAEATLPEPDILQYKVTGYLTGDRFIPDDVNVRPEIENITKQFEIINLVEPGLDKFIRVKAGRMYENGPLVYEGEEFSLGPEDDVLEAFLEEQTSVDFIPNVSPALDCAFRYETWRRAETVKIREEERIAREKEEKRQKLRESLGNGALRREMAVEDFEEAAKAALRVGGAEFLDHRPSRRRDEMVVRFRYLNRRFECTCNSLTLRIIDAGICLTSESTGEKGDTYFTLESLPPVISEAYVDDRLVQYRH